MAELTQEVWARYVDRLTGISENAENTVRRYLTRGGSRDAKALTDIAYAVATRNGEAAAALAAEMYDAEAMLEGVTLAPAVPAATATYGETAAAVRGALEISENDNLLSAVVGRLVKLAGADTAIQNAKRDNAEWAWIPMGDTCAYCIALASGGWQPASSAQMSGNHASHIHANCDCMFAVRHSGSGGVRGYDPQKYRDMYYGADLDGESPNAKNRINALRREFYAENRDEINAQKRSAYAKRIELNSSKAEETNV